MAEKEIKKILSAYTKETKRHFDVTAEDIKGEIKILAEQVATNTEKLEEHDQRFDKIDESLEKVESDISVIKMDIGTIKNDLKQKVSREEFVVLEKRVSMLEAKSHK